MMDAVYTVKLFKADGEALVSAAGEEYRITMADYMQSGIEDGAPVEDDVLAFLEAAAEKLACIKKAFVYLSYRALPVKKLKLKLKKAGFGGEAVEKAVELLLKKGYLDDESLCAEWAAFLHKSKLYGASRLKKELFAKGFDSGCISGALDSLVSDAAYRPEEALNELILKKFPSLSPEDREARSKAVAYLYRFGYTYDEINNAISKLGRD